MSRVFDSLLRASLEADTGNAKRAQRPAPPSAEPVSAPAWPEEAGVASFIDPKVCINLKRNSRTQLLVSSRDPHVQEQYLSLGSRLFRARRSSRVRTVAISSCAIGDGKTLTTANLGVVFGSKTHRKILLVDADFRDPGLTKLFGVESLPGLADVLSNGQSCSKVIYRTNIGGLHFVPAGRIPSVPLNLLEKPILKDFLQSCGDHFDLLLVDTPPLQPFVDFDLINAACDGVLLIVRAGRTPRDLLEAAVEGLAGKNVIGVVMNDYRSKSRYGYYSNASTISSEGEKAS